MSNAPVPPMVMWAQRPNLIFLTVCLEDCKDPEIKVDNDKLFFKSIGGPEKKMHELTINLFKEVDPEKSKFAVRDRVIEFALEKKDGGPYWKRLVKEEKKQHWLKVDFNKWKDEDESDEEGGGGQDLEEMMKQMGGLGGGMGGMGGMPGMPGGMPGMPGMGMPDMGNLGGGKGMERPSLDDLDAEEDSDDEELPDLE